MVKFSHALFDMLSKCVSHVSIHMNIDCNTLRSAFAANSNFIQTKMYLRGTLW